MNTEVKQHLAQAALAWDSAWELLVLLVVVQILLREEWTVFYQCQIATNWWKNVLMAPVSDGAPDTSGGAKNVSVTRNKQQQKVLITNSLG